MARGIRVGKERVRRIMQEHGIKARGKRKFVVTTDSKHKLPVAANLLQRNFTAAAPNQVWTGDITYIATDEGWLYLAVPGCSSGSVQPAGGGLEHAGAHARLTGDGCIANGVVPACSRQRRDLSLRQGQSTLRS